MARMTQYTADSRGYRARQVIRSLEEEEEEDPREEEFEGGVQFPELLCLILSLLVPSRSSDNRANSSLSKKKR